MTDFEFFTDFIGFTTIQQIKMLSKMKISLFLNMTRNKLFFRQKVKKKFESFRCKRSFKFLSSILKIIVV